MRDLRVGDTVVVPWSVSCGDCRECRRDVTAKCSAARSMNPGKALAAFGFGPSCGPWGGVVTDSLRVPYADRMLVRVPDGLDPLRVASAADNLSVAWRSVTPPLIATPDSTVLVIGGGSRSIGLYAAGLAVALGAPRVDYLDDDPDRLTIAEGLGATSATLHVGVSNVRPRLPELLDFIAHSGFPAERVTSALVPWDEAAERYAEHTTKLVVHRAPLDLT